MQQQQRVAVGLLGTPGTPCSGQHSSGISLLPQLHFEGIPLQPLFWEKVVPGLEKH